MQWENLTAAEFAVAVRDTDVCVVAMAVVEKHSEHLPLGTDLFLGHKLACLAAEKEPAVVFPPYYFGKVYEAACFPGAIAIRPSLLIELTQNVFDEIGRNGFKKILVFNAHGGNAHLLSLLTQCHIAEEKPYTLYLTKESVSPEREAAHEAVCPLPEFEHAGELETNLAMALFPELVQMDKVPENPATPLGRLAHLPGLFTGMHWYGDFPDHYAGDARKADPEKAGKLLEVYVDTLADQIRAVKDDRVSPALAKEFFGKVRQLGRMTDST